MSIDEILNLDIGTRVIFTHGNVTEERVIGKVLCRLSAISTSGTYMPLNKETYQKYGYKIELA